MKKYVIYEGYHFYYDPITGAYRVAKRIDRSSWCVVKIFFNENIRSVKFWRNVSLSDVAKHWNTLPIKVNVQVAHRLIEIYQSLIKSTVKSIVKIKF